MHVHEEHNFVHNVVLPVHVRVHVHVGLKVIEVAHDMQQQVKKYMI